MTVSTQAANIKSYLKARTLTIEQLDSCLKNGELQRRFKRYASSGRSRSEGPMAETEALEEAMMDVFVGAKNRGFRVYRNYATEEHVKRLKRIMADKLEGMKVEMFLPDMVGLRSQLRKTSDMGTLSQYLAAEQGGRNDDNKVRPEAVKAILARISSVQKNEESVAKHVGATEEQLAAASSKA